MSQVCVQVLQGLGEPTVPLQAQRVWYQDLQTAVVSASVQVVENGYYEPLLEVEPALPVDPPGGLDDDTYLQQMKARLETIQQKGGYQWPDSHADVTNALAQTRVEKVTKGGWFSGSTTTYHNELELKEIMQREPALFVKLLVLARIPDDVLGRALSAEGRVLMFVKKKDGGSSMESKYADGNEPRQFNQSFMLKQLFDKVDHMSKQGEPCLIFCTDLDSGVAIDVPSCSKSEIRQLLVGANKEAQHGGEQTTEVKSEDLVRKASGPPKADRAGSPKSVILDSSCLRRKSR